MKTIRFLSLALAFVLVGCSDDGGNEPNPSIAVSLGGTVTVVQGQTGTTQVTVTRGGGFSGAVTLTASALPVGVTAAFDPATIPAGSGNGTSTLTLTAGANAPTGAGTFTVAASGGANVSATANGSVTISPAPDYSLNVTPNAVAVDQGSQGVLNVAITRTGGFTGAVNLSVANLPTGVTAAFDNAAPTGNTAVLTLTASPTATLGPAVITVNGTASAGNKSAQFTLTVQAPPGSFTLAANPTTVSVAQAAAGNTTITVNKTGSFTGAVALTVTGLPSGVTASFNPTSASAAASTQDVQTTSVLTLTAGAGVTVGDHPLVVHGNAQGQTEKTVNLTLTITPAATGGYTLSTDPDEITIRHGSNATTTVTISKTGTFTGNVTLSATGLPAGVTATFAPPQASPRVAGSTDVQTTSVMTITVAPTAVVNTYPIVIHGTAEGLAERTNFIDLTVTTAFNIALNPTTLSVQAGQNGQTTVTINKTGTFASNVFLSVTNLPAGITAAFNPASGSAGKSPSKSPSKTTDTQVQSTLTLTVDPTVAPQEYSLNVRGISEGYPNSDATLTLTVTPAPGDYSLSVNPTTISIQQGQNGPATVTISKTGSFTGNVTLSAVGLPANVTAAFNPPAASPPRISTTRDVQTQSVMTLTVGGSVAPNNYPFQIKGVAEGKADKLIDATLTVTAPPGPGNSHIKFCDLANLPLWFAFKDGGGPWTQVTGTVAGDGTTYSFTINQATGAYAVVTGNTTDGYTTTVTYATQAQLTGGTATCPTAAFTRTLNGSVSNIGATDLVNVSMGGGSATALSVPGTFQLLNVLDGASDLIAVRNQVSAGPPFANTPIGIIIRRGLNIANNGTIPVLNFGAAEAFAPATAAITIDGGSGDNVLASLGYVTPTTTATLESQFNQPSPVTLRGIPAGQQDAQDLHSLMVSAGGLANGTRLHLRWFKTLAAQTVDVGTFLTSPTVSVLGTAPYPRIQVTAPIQTLYNDVFSTIMNQEGPTDADTRGWVIIANGGVFAGANYTLAIEDLSAAGYQLTWALVTGRQVNLTTSAAGFSTNGIANPIIEGGRADIGQRSSVITP